VLPVLSERFSQGDGEGVTKVLRGVVIVSGLAILPFVLAGSIASPWIMGLYGASYRDGWPTFVLVLITAGLTTASNPVGYFLAASESLWTGVFLNAGWALAFIGMTHVLVVRLGAGALGLASARLVAYVAHTIIVFWYAAHHLRTTARTTVST
jgi:O-antigen/teichoic acid export membrane protein